MGMWMEIMVQKHLDRATKTHLSVQMVLMEGHRCQQMFYLQVIRIQGLGLMELDHQLITTQKVLFHSL